MSVLTKPPAPDPSHPLWRMPTAAELPSDDGEPMETYWHRQAMNQLCEVAEYHLRGRDDVFIGGNMFVYFGRDQVFNKDFRGPDVFIVNGGVDRHKDRPSWVMWEENNRLPDVIVELVSETTGHIDRVVKKELYATRFGTHEYYVVDPAGWTIEGWRMAARPKRYVPITPRDGRLWCEVLGVWLGFWHGPYYNWTTNWPRLFSDDGNPVPTFREAAEGERDGAVAVAEAERRNAEAERRNAEAERRNAEAERRNAEAAQERAEAERRNAEAERANAEAAQAALASARREAAARVDAAEAARQAAEAELARLKAELAALRPPPAP
jgi:Uma2 family endonuclease